MCNLQKYTFKKLKSAIIVRRDNCFTVANGQSGPNLVGACEAGKPNNPHGKINAEMCTSMKKATN